MTGSKNKGNAFERETCKLLSKWWTFERRDDAFWRTQSSGGRATQRTKKGKRTAGQYGDVAAVDDEGAPLLRALTIELKRGYPNATVTDLIERNVLPVDPTPLEAFFASAQEDAAASKSFGWAVIHRRDRKVAMIYLDAQTFHELEAERNPVVAAAYVRIGYAMPKESKFRRECVGMPFDMFLLRYDPSQFRELAKCVQ